MTPRRAIVASLAGLLLAGGGRAQSGPWASLRTTGHFALIRHALAPGTFDPPDFRVDDCTTQRNLSAQGRAQAVGIGDLFRANGIASVQLHASQWCRCLETATLLKLGEVRPQPLLNSFAQNQDRATEQTLALRFWLNGLELEKPAVLVTHQVVITALSDVFPGNGEIVVMQRLSGGRFAFVGRLPTA